MIATASSVCVVDDDRSVRRGLARLLRSAGFVVETYPSAEEFLDASGWVGRVCLIVDIHMPGMSGLALRERLTAGGITVPVVLITAHDDPTTQELARQGGATYLRKPFSESALLAAIQEAIARHGGSGESP